jgi:hypothetical protein
MVVVWNFNDCLHFRFRSTCRTSPTDCAVAGRWHYDVLLTIDATTRSWMKARHRVTDHSGVRICRSRNPGGVALQEFGRAISVGGLRPADSDLWAFAPNCCSELWVEQVRVDRGPDVLLLPLSVNWRDSDRIGRTGSMGYPQCQPKWRPQ